MQNFLVAKTLVLNVTLFFIIYFGLSLFYTYKSYSSRL